MFPVGSIISYYGDERTFDATGPWLICDGSAISRTQYPELYNHLVRVRDELKIDAERCHLPDLRGMFLRGVDSDRQVDPNRELGSEQKDGIKKHSFQIRTREAAGPGSSSGLDGGSLMFMSGDRIQTIRVGNADETRPINVAVNWLIRVRT